MGQALWSLPCALNLQIYLTTGRVGHDYFHFTKEKVKLREENMPFQGYSLEWHSLALKQSFLGADGRAKALA
jgi:hypothetical protein